MFDKLREKLNRKIIVSLLLICFAAVATVGGIRYFEFRQRLKLVQNPAYRTALGILALEQYPKLALSTEQAKQLLPVVRELAGVRGVPADGEKIAEAMKKVLTREQLDFVAVAGDAGLLRGPAGPAGLRGLNVENDVYGRFPGHKLSVPGHKFSRDFRVRPNDDGPKRNRIPGWLPGRGFRGAAAFDLLLEVLMQKVYG